MKIRDERGCPNATKTKNLKVIIWFFAVILYVGLVTNAGFAQESVKTELKEVATPRPPTEPIPTPEPPFELDNETKAEIVKLLVEKFNITYNEIKISTATKTRAGDRIFLYTNLGKFTYKDGEIYSAGLKFEPGINETLAEGIIKEELKKKGLITESTIFYNFEAGTVNLCWVQYKTNSTDLNTYPTGIACLFNFDNAKGEAAVYEIWAASIDSSTGEIIKLEKEDEKIFKRVKTPEEAVAVIKNNKNLSVDPSEIVLSYRGEPAWIYQYQQGLWLFVHDDWKVEERPMPVLFDDIPPPRSTNISSKIFDFRGLFAVFLLTIGYLLLKLKKRGNK